MRTAEFYRARRGVTLLELILVITILGILAVLIVPNFVGVGERARHKTVVASIKELENNIARFEADVGRLPESLQELVEKPDDWPEEQTWHPYLRHGKLPVDPWGSPYQYVKPGEHNEDYDLFSPGPDRQPGTDDDIGNW